MGQLEEWSQYICWFSQFSHSRIIPLKFQELSFGEEASMKFVQEISVMYHNEELVRPYFCTNIQWSYTIKEFGLRSDNWFTDWVQEPVQIDHPFSVWPGKEKIYLEWMVLQAAGHEPQHYLWLE